MGIVGGARVPRAARAALLGLALVAATGAPAEAQNRKKAWEVFIYFGEYGGQTVPSAIQQGMVYTYRIDGAQTAQTLQDPNSPPGPTNPYVDFCPRCQNAGATGPGTQFITPGNPPAAFDPPCRPGGVIDPQYLDENNPFLDECDNDFEAVYRYNANRIVTNGGVQRNDSEFLLGARAGYNITRHWEVELDLGFAKQRLDMTKNLIPLLGEPVSNPADPWFQRLADFYHFTWANRDYYWLGYQPLLDPNGQVVLRGMQEIPNVPHRRVSRNASADIPAILPEPNARAEHFEDVTDFINRVLLDPTAFRNRANQINIDIFSVGLSGVYNFNTKPDSRIVPYLQAGAGRWMRGYDFPYEGENSDYFSYGGGVRFFVNEIFSFRAELRGMAFRQETSTITAELPRQNLLDNGGIAGCFRDQEVPAQEPPFECPTSYIVAYIGACRPGQSCSQRLPENHRAGGYASLEIVTETDDFWEARIGFDVLLGGK